MFEWLTYKYLARLITVCDGCESETDWNWTSVPIHSVVTVQRRAGVSSCHLRARSDVRTPIQLQSICAQAVVCQRRATIAT